MPEALHHRLSRRERQIMDSLYRRGEATAADVQEDLPDAPSYSAVRAHLRILEEKGHISHHQEGPRYIYRPAVSKERATRSALRHLVDTFFDGSSTRAMAALLDEDASDLSDDEVARLSKLIELARDPAAGQREEANS